MYGEPNYSEIVKDAFSKNGVDNPQLEKAISDILSQTLNTRELSQRLYKTITENQERDERIRNAFK